MAINEAPLLTTRVVALLMIVVFFLCIAADQFQCNKNGRLRFCSGRAPYHCASYPCREQLVGHSPIRVKQTCRFKGTSEVLLAFVELGPSLVSVRGDSVSDYMVDELRQRIKKSEFESLWFNPLTGPGGASYLLRDVEMVNQYYMLSSSLRALRKCPRNTTQYTVTNDIIRTPLHQVGQAARHNDWDEAIEAVLPTSKLDDPTQLKKHFPNLYHALHAAVSRRKTSTAADSACDSLNIVVYTLVSPLASVRVLWESPELAQGSTKEAYPLISGAVNRYIATNKHFLKYLTGVHHAYLYVAHPSRQFDKIDWSSEKNGFRTPFVRLTEAPPPLQNLTAADAVPKLVRDLSTSVAFCNASRNESHATSCLQGCSKYDEYNKVAVYVTSLAAIEQLKNGQLFSTVLAAAPQYYDCYVDVLRGSAPLLENGTFGVAAEASMFDDCLHLSPAGGRAFASCLLKAKGNVPRSWDVGETSYS